MVLALHFHNGRASAVMACLMMLAVVVQTTGLLDAQISDSKLATAMVAASSMTLVGVYVFLVYCGHSLPFIWWDRTWDRYFLDICVICQTDPVLMKQGINHLAEFLLVSQELIICWTPMYTSRIWCICELAVFFKRMQLLERKGENNMKLVLLPIVFAVLSQVITAVT